jgi:hypothetical protein
MLKQTISVIFFSLFEIMYQGGGDWQLKTDKNGIEVFTRPEPGSRVKAVKSVCTIKSSLSGIVAILLDIPAYHKWIYRCSSAEVVKKINPSDLIYYQETSVPWPASNRDFVVQLKIIQDKQTGIVTATVENKPGVTADKSGKVRLQKYNEKVVIVPKGKDQVEVTTELSLDPGGNIPAWMINLAITDGPYETSAGMIKMVQSGAYKNAHYDFIKEP